MIQADEFSKMSMYNTKKKMPVPHGNKALGTRRFLDSLAVCTSQPLKSHHDTHRQVHGAARGPHICGWRNRSWLYRGGGLPRASARCAKDVLLPGLAE